MAPKEVDGPSQPEQRIAVLQASIQALEGLRDAPGQQRVDENIGIIRQRIDALRADPPTSSIAPAPVPGEF